MRPGVPELDAGELLHEWRKLMDTVVSSTTSVAGPPELVRELVDRERALQREILGRLIAPLDAGFDLLEQSGATLRQQAEALEEAGRALEQTAALMKSQAELFERTIAAMRQPAEVAKAVGGLPARPRRQRAHQGRRSGAGDDRP